MLMSETESHGMWVAAASPVLSTGPVINTPYYPCIYQGKVEYSTEQSQLMLCLIISKQRNYKYLPPVS